MRCSETCASESSAPCTPESHQSQNLSRLHHQQHQQQLQYQLSIQHQQQQQQHGITGRASSLLVREAATRHRRAKSSTLQVCVGVWFKGCFQLH